MKPTLAAAALVTLLASPAVLAAPEFHSLESRGIIEDIINWFKGKKPPKFWIGFGDSYTQTWFNVTGEQPNRVNPFGNPEFPGYTACGLAYNWVDYAVQTYNTSTVLTYNHAYGGAVIDPTLVTPWQPGLKHLTNQTEDFLTYNAPGKPFYPGWRSDNTIFTYWIGINDIGNSHWLPGPDERTDALLSRYFELVEKTYQAGGRNYLFLNVPPIYLTPLMLTQTQEARDGEKAVLATFNKKLKAKVEAFKKSHRGVTTFFYDTDALYLKIYENPAKYGLKDATSYGPEDDVAWCNDYHFSPAVHKFIGEGVSKLLKHRFI